MDSATDEKVKGRGARHPRRITRSRDQETSDVTIRFIKLVRGPWCVVGYSVVVIGLTVICTVAWWPELTTNGDSPSAVIRNMSLIAGGLVTLAFAIWRGQLASRQAELT